MNIGVFDSGIGGLTILNAFVRDLPHYTYNYYGDNANAPYGEKSSDEIYRLTIKGIEFLFAKNCHVVVLACNTSSTILPRIQQEYLPRNYPDKKVLGVIRPTAEAMIEARQTEVYLMATPATVLAKSYEKELSKLGSAVKISSIPCPGLAKAIEESNGKMSPTINDLLDKYLGNISKKNTERDLYLACTHYEHVQSEIERKYPGRVVSQSSFVSAKFADYLKRHPELPLDQKSARQEIFFSAPLRSL